MTFCGVEAIDSPQTNTLKHLLSRGREWYKVFPQVPVDHSGNNMFTNITVAQNIDPLDNISAYNKVSLRKLFTIS